MKKQNLFPKFVSHFPNPNRDSSQEMTNLLAQFVQCEPKIF